MAVEAVGAATAIQSAETRKLAASRRWTRQAVSIALLMALAYFLRYPLMSAAAWAWLVNDPLEKGDVVVVLGGGADSRPFTAAELYKRGFAPVVLVADPSPRAARQMQPLRTDGELAVDVLRKMGVAESAIVRFGGPLASTRDEAQGVRKWLEQRPAHRLIIPTDPFHTRRVRFIFERELKGLAVQLTVMSIPNKRYDPLEWWKSAEAKRIFRSEIIKFVFYCLHR